MVKRLGVVLAILFAVACVTLCVCLPLKERISLPKEEEYVCVWSNGERTQENDRSALNALAGGDFDGATLKKGNEQGEITLSQAYQTAYRTLFSGSLLEKRTLSVDELSRLERATLTFTFSDFLFWESEPFLFNGNRVEKSKAVERGNFVYMGGNLPKNAVAQSGAKTLYLQTEEEITFSHLKDSAVERVVASSPYYAERDGIYYQTAGGNRLICSLPSATELTVGNVAFIDEGALLPSKNLTALTLPFLGSTALDSVTNRRAELYYLFQEGENYSIPQSLKRVTVTGGKVENDAFYGCSLEELNLCGVTTQKYALRGVQTLKRVHAPNAELILQGNFTKAVAPCGCTVYERQ